MVADANPRDAPGDAAALRGHAEALAGGIVAALGPWVERVVAERAEQWRPGSGASLRPAAAAAGADAAAEVGAAVRELLATDVDEQRTGPLALLRSAVRFPTAVLAGAGLPGVERDEFAERAFPADVYDLAPAAFADLDPDLAELGLVWGAAKAHVVLARRRAEGLR
ncbi:hypothetical protein KSP35_11955 [Aquihabitans sp. G128]|uniref:hypothetical protein n=1 Tax=Aquihabitans sp. G128 TaxID=2849779 RepID=UPI001C210FA8|nr:hypothetical protein [Aquihabitans sp. G128]QXC59129.1 hypothetical protein KSP35_11955 [Aquihabitans sp. G128]